MALKPGTQCPDFEIPHHLDGVAKLNDYKGKILIVAFHPFSFTGGWTTQVCGFRDHVEKLNKMGISVIEISCDSIPTQKAFSESLGGISFPIGSDFHPQGFISRKFDVYNEEKGNSKRAVFIINKDGKIHFSQEFEPGNLPQVENLIKKVNEII